MKSVRVWYKKTDTAKYISHLDMNRCMTRVLQRTGIPIWRTEGFNPHPFITFALPLSLGFSGENESMDMKLIGDIEYDEIISKMNECLPLGVRVFNITEPIMKPGEIAKAEFNIVLEAADALLTSERLKEDILKFFSLDSIIVQKKTKSGIKDIDLKPHITEYTVKTDGNKLIINMLLPAGSSENINPSLIFDEAEKQIEYEFLCDITRVNVYNKNGEIFR